VNRAPATEPVLRLLLADDHEMVRVAIRHALTALAPSIELDLALVATDR